MKKIRWAELTRARQDLYITLLWRDGHSEQAIADFLHTTKGIIVRRRQSHLAKVKRVSEKVKGVVDPERFQDLLDLQDMKEVEEKNEDVISFAPPKRKIAGSSASQCEHVGEDGRQCAYEVTNTKMKRCSLHE